jgi:hypothetical protein
VKPNQADRVAPATPDLISIFRMEDEVIDAAQSNAPALGYTGAYAFANVILTLAGTLIMLLAGDLYKRQGCS